MSAEFVTRGEQAAPVKTSAEKVTAITDALLDELQRRNECHAACDTPIAHSEFLAEMQAQVAALNVINALAQIGKK